MPGKDPDTITKLIRSGMKYVDKIKDDPAIEKSDKVALLTGSKHFAKIAAEPSLTLEEIGYGQRRLAQYTGLAVKSLTFGWPPTFRDKAFEPLLPYLETPAYVDPHAQAALT